MSIEDWRVPEESVGPPIHRLGSGCFGRVFEAAYGDRTVAFKIMKHAIDPVFFFNEIYILSMMSHAHVPAFYGYVHSEKKSAILLEKVDGVSLTDLLCFYDISLYDSARIARQVVDALGYMHSLRILYRDMKMDNIMVHPTTLHTHIVDFGLACMLPAGDQVMRGRRCGTPGYIAPEVMENRPYGLAADIYSLGVVLFVLFARRDPAARKKMHNALLRSPMSPGLRNLILRCLSVVPGERPLLGSFGPVLSSVQHRPTRRWWACLFGTCCCP